MLGRETSLPFVAAWSLGFSVVALSGPPVLRAQDVEVLELVDPRWPEHGREDAEAEVEAFEPSYEEGMGEAEGDLEEVVGGDELVRDQLFASWRHLVIDDMTAAILTDQGVVANVELEAKIRSEARRIGVDPKAYQVMSRSVLVSLEASGDTEEVVLARVLPVAEGTFERLAGRRAWPLTTIGLIVVSALLLVFLVLVLVGRTRSKA